jgi:hypothetical protein
LTVLIHILMLSVDHCGDLGGCDGLISPLWSSELHGIQSYINHIGGVIVSMNLKVLDLSPDSTHYDDSQPISIKQCCIKTII